MKHIFKQESIRELVKYNRYLLLTCAVLAVSTFISSISLITREEKWVLIPAIETERRMNISSSGYSETYLKEWAIFVMKGIFTTSPEEVERQVADMRVISSATKEMDKFFKDHIEFVKGSKVSSVFFPKKTQIIENGVIISGTFRYWFGETGNQSVDKSYIVKYKRLANHLLLLTDISEQTNEGKNDK